MADQRAVHFVDTGDPTVKTVSELSEADRLIGHVATEDFAFQYTVVARQDGAGFTSVTLNSESVLGRGVTGNITSLDMPTLRNLLNVEDGATADMTGNEIILALIPVAGSTSGLDADLLDGVQGAGYSLSGHTHEGLYASIDQGVPLGGVTNYVLTKRSDSPTDFSWAPAPLDLVFDQSPQLGGDLDLGDGQTVFRIVEGANEILRYEAGGIYLGGFLVTPTDIGTAETGDLLVYSAPNAQFEDLDIGLNGQALIADSAEALGIRWGTVSPGGIHAPDHVTGGTDEIDGDQLDIDWNPTNYTPATTPAEVTSVDHLTSHLFGVDTILGAFPASNLTGTLADGLVVASNVTQHEASINHDALLNSDAGKHRVINDASTSTTELWSSDKINTEIAAIVHPPDAVDSVFGRTGAVVAVADDYTASEVTNVPAGTIIATDVQAAIDELDSEKSATTHNHDADYAALAHTHAATDITSGTLPEARISELGVTQHEAAIDHNALDSYDAAQHRIINDAGTSATELWSASKINTDLGGKSAIGHIHAATQITSGVFVDARVQESNVTQHAGAINAEDLGDVPAYATNAALFLRVNATEDGIEYASSAAPVDSVYGRTGAVVAVADDYTAAEVTNVPAGAIAATDVQGAINELDTEKAASVHTHAAADITSGTFADALVAESNVTQHEAAISHDALADFAAGEHRVINDAGTLTTELFSAAEIISRLAGKSDTSHNHDADYAALAHTHAAADVTSGEFPTARIADEAITHAKLAHVLTDSFLGRTTAATGDVETLTADQAMAVLNTGTTDIADAHIGVTGVTQHVASIDHDSLLNWAAGQHRVINDAGTSATELWSASKISTELAGKSATSHNHDADYADIAHTHTTDLEDLNDVGAYATNNYKVLRVNGAATDPEWSLVTKDSLAAGSVTATQLADAAVTHAKLAHVVTDSLLGRTTAATGDVETLTADQAQAVLNTGTTDVADGNISETGVTQHAAAINAEDLGDVPAYATNGSLFLRVKAAEDGIEYAASAAPVDSVFGRTGAVAAAADDYTASEVTNVPAGSIAATDVQAAINELDSEKSATGHNHDADYAALVHTHAAADVTSGEFGTARLADEAVTHAKLAHVVTDSFLGRTTAATGDVETLTADQAITVGNTAGTSTWDSARINATLSGKTLVTPTIASMANATHDHEDAAGGGTLTTAAISNIDYAGTGKVTISVTKPTTPSNEDVWLNLDDGTWYVYDSVEDAWLGSEFIRTAQENGVVNSTLYWGFPSIYNSNTNQNGWPAVWVSRIGLSCQGASYTFAGTIRLRSDGSTDRITQAFSWASGTKETFTIDDVWHSTDYTDEDESHSINVDITSGSITHPILTIFCRKYIPG